MSLQVDIVTIERRVFQGEVDMVIAPGIKDKLGILPSHAPLISLLNEGELRVKQGEKEHSFAIGGGYLEVLNDEVTVLADTAERADEIDISRAAAARERAERLLKEEATDWIDRRMIEGALRRSKVRLQVARKRRRSRSRGPSMEL